MSRLRITLTNTTSWRAAYLSTRHYFMAWYLTKQRESFTFIGLGAFAASEL